MAGCLWVAIFFLSWRARASGPKHYTWIDASIHFFLPLLDAILLLLQLATARAHTHTMNLSNYMASLATTSVRCPLSRGGAATTNGELGDRERQEWVGSLPEAPHALVFATCYKPHRKVLVQPTSHAATNGTPFCFIAQTAS